MKAIEGNVVPHVGQGGGAYANDPIGQHSRCNTEYVTSRDNHVVLRANKPMPTSHRAKAVLHPYAPNMWGYASEHMGVRAIVSRNTARMCGGMRQKVGGYAPKYVGLCVRTYGGTRQKTKTQHNEINN